MIKMRKETFQKNAFIYLANILLFSLIFILEPHGADFGIGFLILLLIMSFIFVKQIHTKRNIWQIKNFQVVNINSLIMLILFGNLLLLHWSKFQNMEKIYLIGFCLIQIALIQIDKTKDL
jgi:4-hydroxybenzoate polyprenyltransferase